MNKMLIEAHLKAHLKGQNTYERKKKEFIPVICADML